jgi:hypothetical protein
MGRSHKLAIAAVTAVVAVGAAAFAAFGATDNSANRGSTPSGATPMQQGAQPDNGAGQAPGRLASALASKLGIEASKVAAALQTVHQQLGNGTTPPSQGQLAAALAKALGVDQSKVASALESMGPPGPPPSGQMPQGGQTPPPSGQLPTPPAQSS